MENVSSQYLTGARSSSASSADRNRHTNWCFTYNYGGSTISTASDQPPRDSVERFVDSLVEKCKYVVGGYESAPTSGQLHLQGYCQLKKPARLSELKKLPDGGTVHWEVAVGTEEENRNYCLKIVDGMQQNADFIEEGEATIVHPGAREKRRWGDALASVKRGRLDEVDPQIQICQYNNLRRIMADSAGKPEDLAPGYKHDWYFGPTGTGKSRLAREVLRAVRPDQQFYTKTHNKWWDYYEPGLPVLIDDLGHDVGKHLHDYLKQWLDMYPFASESKGVCHRGGLRPPHIIITSNFHPFEIWGGTKDYEPIMRRLNVKYLGPPGTEPVYDTDNLFVQASPMSQTPVTVSRSPVVVAETPLPLRRSQTVSNLTFDVESTPMDRPPTLRPGTGLLTHPLQESRLAAALIHLDEEEDDEVCVDLTK
jgi:hypothetical protein